ncbi:hypothetical protein [Sinorhizobium meliloti]|uniref:hypothetical protein n=1 Tax=Rhizobium meliloti TaxID=382 RepID=UPI00048361F1|nr:hypothetical protein [Sinorhizobium meliloti]
MVKILRGAAVYSAHLLAAGAPAWKETRSLGFAIEGCIQLPEKQKVDVAAALVYERASILCLPIFVLLRFARLLTNFPLSKVETPLCVAQR